MDTPLAAEHKRKWQIALRRYVLEGRPASEYAPYFGVDSALFRKWVELHFEGPMNWENFGSLWHFIHVVPLCFFKNVEEELKLAWNFINIRPDIKNSEQGSLFTIQDALNYFQELELRTGYEPASKMVLKLRQLNDPPSKKMNLQADFLCEHLNRLEKLQSLSALELELINKGRSMEEAILHAEEIRKLSSLS